MMSEISTPEPVGPLPDDVWVVVLDFLDSVGLSRASRVCFELRDQVLTRQLPFTLNRTQRLWFKASQDLVRTIDKWFLRTIDIDVDFRSEPQNVAWTLRKLICLRAPELRSLTLRCPHQTFLPFVPRQPTEAFCDLLSSSSSSYSCVGEGNSSSVRLNDKTQPPKGAQKDGRVGTLQDAILEALREDFECLQFFNPRLVDSPSLHSCTFSHLETLSIGAPALLRLLNWSGVVRVDVEEISRVFPSLKRLTINFLHAIRTPVLSGASIEDLDEAERGRDAHQHRLLRSERRGSRGVQRFLRAQRVVASCTEHSWGSTLVKNSTWRFVGGATAPVGGATGQATDENTPLVVPSDQCWVDNVPMFGTSLGGRVFDGGAAGLLLEFARAVAKRSEPKLEELSLEGGRLGLVAGKRVKGFWLSNLRRLHLADLRDIDNVETFGLSELVSLERLEIDDLDLSFALAQRLSRDLVDRLPDSGGNGEGEGNGSAESSSSKTRRKPMLPALHVSIGSLSTSPAWSLRSPHRRSFSLRRLSSSSRQQPQQQQPRAAASRAVSGNETESDRGGDRPGLSESSSFLTADGEDVFVSLQTEDPLLTFLRPFVIATKKLKQKQEGKRKNLAGQAEADTKPGVPKISLTVRKLTIPRVQTAACSSCAAALLRRPSRDLPVEGSENFEEVSAVVGGEEGGSNWGRQWAEALECLGQAGLESLTVTSAQPFDASCLSCLRDCARVTSLPLSAESVFPVHLPALRELRLVGELMESSFLPVVLDAPVLESVVWDPEPSPSLILALEAEGGEGGVREAEAFVEDRKETQQVVSKGAASSARSSMGGENENETAGEESVRSNFLKRVPTDSRLGLDRLPLLRKFRFSSESGKNIGCTDMMEEKESKRVEKTRPFDLTVSPRRSVAFFDYSGGQGGDGWGDREDASVRNAHVSAALLCGSRDVLSCVRTLSLPSSAPAFLETAVEMLTRKRNTLPQLQGLRFGPWKQSGVMAGYDVNEGGEKTSRRWCGVEDRFISSLLKLSDRTGMCVRVSGDEESMTVAAVRRGGASVESSASSSVCASGTVGVVAEDGKKEPSGTVSFDVVFTGGIPAWLETALEEEVFSA
uniref:F-box domain-containing protein n=1 Tax=Chromera velia CCMP2878 TaxID=1169474 RepID=A0A0G4H908_9ALVE|eukprot:Cvel_25122.t1-p1 / transcript=Cvel_25122.t1 / gene=Cvel_25122 / organism=Chromera_velia_CCMP2878 / gene_product=hypothetical protein / transcript_product=hypothetical protein / location=Cvel_scaffold2805:3568-7231(-) / protein_length=1102 / sequence_SO=supercontig / SO=protein_coding / is_pseudo=false